MNIQELQKKYGTHGLKLFANIVNQLGSDGHDFSTDQVEIIGDVLTDVGNAFAGGDA